MIKYWQIADYTPTNPTQTIHNTAWIAIRIFIKS